MTDRESRGVQKRRQGVGRRNFLKISALCATGAGVGAITNSESTEAAETRPAKPTKRYRESAHVREVYRLARF